MVSLAGLRRVVVFHKMFGAKRTNGWRDLREPLWKMPRAVRPGIVGLQTPRRDHSLCGPSCHPPGAGQLRNARRIKEIACRRGETAANDARFRLAPRW